MLHSPDGLAHLCHLVRVLSGPLPAPLPLRHYALHLAHLLAQAPPALRLPRLRVPRHVLHRLGVPLPPLQSLRRHSLPPLKLGMKN